MTCKRTYVIQCDHRDKATDNPNLIQRCQRAMIAYEGETTMGLKVRAKNDGWAVDLPNAVGMPCHYCGDHA